MERNPFEAAFEVKADDTAIRAAAMAMVVTGMEDGEVAKVCGVERAKIREWRYEYGVNDINARTLEDRKDDLGDLLYEYLQQSLRALIAQLGLFQNIEWLTKQKAGELALLHGVISDKATRILGALRVDDRERVAESTPETRILEAEVS